MGTDVVDGMDSAWGPAWCSPGPARTSTEPKAAVAAAMDCEVELHFTGPAVRLLVDGVAANLRPKAGEKSIYGHMQDAAEQGARFLGCSLALRDYLAPDETKIAEFSGTVGAATFIMRTLDPEWRVMYF